MPKAKNKKAANNKPLPVQVRLVARPDTPFYYVNFMGVNSGLFDFTFGVVRLPAEYTPEQTADIKAGKAIEIEPTLQLVVPPILAKTLITALTSQVTKYEGLFGEIIVPKFAERKTT